MPEISVVIPCYNGATTLIRQLDALAAQKTESTFEVCVADNRSSDNSAAIIEEYSARDSRFRYVTAFERQGINHARNAGVRASSGRFVLLCDADDVVSETWIEEYARAFASGASLVGGPLRHIVDGEVAGDQVGFIPSPWIYSWPYGANCGFSREAYDAIGGFDESYRGGGDETDFYWRAQIRGYDLQWVDNAWIDYFSRSSVKAVFRQKYAYGLSEVKLYKRFKPLGMPRKSLFRGPVAVGLAAVGFVVDPKNRRQHSARLGRNWGRIVGSAKYRTLYL